MVDFLSNTREFSDPERWAAFEAQMERGELESVQKRSFLQTFEQTVLSRDISHLKLPII